MPIILAAASLVVLAILAAGMVCWALAALKLAAGVPLVFWRWRRRVPWTLLDLLATLGLFFLAILVLRLVLDGLGWLPDVPDEAKLSLADKGLLVWANIGISLGLLVVALPLIAWRCGASVSDFGLSRDGLLGDLKLGLIGFVMLAPPVYAIQGLLTYFWSSKHPLMEMFKTSPDPGFFAVLVLAAAIVAPLFEELVFRVLLQGYLEKVFGKLQPGPANAPAVIGAPAPDGQSATLSPPVLAEPAHPSQAPLDPNPYAPPATGELATPLTTQNAADRSQPPLAGLWAWLPIVISSLVFSLLHLTHGPDWVALTLLAAGMGYLYQRTHRLVPSLVVHALLNSVSMFGLWIQVYAPLELIKGH